MFALEFSIAENRPETSLRNTQRSVCLSFSSQARPKSTFRIPDRMKRPFVVLFFFYGWTSQLKRLNLCVSGWFVSCSPFGSDVRSAVTSEWNERLLENHLLCFPRFPCFVSALKIDSLCKYFCDEKFMFKWMRTKDKYQFSPACSTGVRKQLLTLRWTGQDWEWIISRFIF